MEIRTIVVPFDFSKYSEKAFAWALAMAGQWGARLRQVRRYGHITRFLIARMVYIDGLATVFACGGVYAAGVEDQEDTRVYALA